MLTTIKTNNREKKQKNRENTLTKTSLLYQHVSWWLLRLFKKMPSLHSYNLTISEERKFIWYRVAKVSSRTIFDMFEKADIILSAENTYYCHYAPNEYQDFFRFAFVRNPWDRLVSCWLDKIVGYNFYEFEEEEYAKMQDFATFVDWVATQDAQKIVDPHLRAQSALIDLNFVDFIGRFENFSADFQKVMKHLGIENVEIAKKNVTKNRRPYQDYYTESTSQKVAEIYRKDIQIFNYEF